MAQGQRARLITARSLDRNELPVFIIRSFQNCHAVYTAHINRYGVIRQHVELTSGSKLQDQCLLPVHQGTRATLTGMAQRQRARLITARTYDRNVLPVSISICLLYRNRPSSWTLNVAGIGITQRKRWTAGPKS